MTNDNKAEELRHPLNFAGHDALQGLGLPLRLVTRLNKLGFVLAGGAAAYLMDVVQGREPATVPSDFDFFYKGTTLRGAPLSHEVFRGIALNCGFEERAYASRLGMAIACLKAEGLSRVRSTVYSETYRGKTVVERPGLFQVREKDDPMDSPWEDKPVVEDLPLQVRDITVQLITAGDRDTVRSDTLQDRVLEVFRATPASGHSALELALSKGLNEDPTALHEEILDWNGRDRTPLSKPVAVWHRFDFTAISAELDGDTLLYHPALPGDREARRLRIQNLNRNPVKMLSRIQKYVRKGFSMSPEATLQFIGMAGRLGQAERELLSDYLDTMHQATRAGLPPSPGRGIVDAETYDQLGEAFDEQLRQKQTIMRYSSEVDLTPLTRRNCVIVDCAKGPFSWLKGIVGSWADDWGWAYFL